MWCRGYIFVAIFYICICAWQNGYNSVYIGVALLLGLLLGAAVIVLVLFILYRVIGRNPYACLERRHGDKTSTTPASVFTTINVTDDDDNDEDDGYVFFLYDSLSYELVDKARKR